MEAHVTYHWQGSCLCHCWKHFHGVNTKIYAERSKRESKRVTWGIDNALQWHTSIWYIIYVPSWLDYRFQILEGAVIFVDEWKLKAEKL